MTDRPRLTQLDLWGRHELRVLELLCEALELLVREAGDDERALNRRLYTCILVANHSRYVRGAEAFDYPPEYEGRNAPTPDTEGSPAENKVPDFAWRYLDNSVDDPARSSRDYHVECKRLGEPTSSGWELNRNYVANGVVRFRDPDFRYGKDVASGAMVGYIESMSFEDVLEEVNCAADEASIPRLSPVQRHSEELHEHENSLERSFAMSPFRLAHLWIDLVDQAQ